MSVGEALRDLGQFLDECENSDGVRGVELSGGDSPRGGAPLGAEIEVAFALRQSEDDGGLSLRAAEADPDEGLQFTFASPQGMLPAADHGIEIDVTDATVESDGRVTATVSASVPVEDGSGETSHGSTPIADESDGSIDAGRERDVPPFRDPELLEEVYTSCDTFAEMTDEIGMDVTAETVRRYMIDHGIHEPNSYATADTSEADGPHDASNTDGHGDASNADGAGPGTAEEDTDATDADSGGVDGVDTDDTETAPGDDGEQVVLADGIGLPDDVTAETLIETVQRSDTILEVKQEIGIERQDALEMLQKLNLIDLVIGRLTTETERDISREEVIERLREASATA